jgi:hypothetical protein
MGPAAGLEPATDCLQDSCATIAPRWPSCHQQDSNLRHSMSLPLGDGDMVE